MLELTGNVYPDLVKVFYTNLTLDRKNVVSYVKGIKMKNTSEVWNSVAGIKYAGLKVGKGNTSGISEFNKLQYYKSCMRKSYREYKQVPCRAFEPHSTPSCIHHSMATDSNRDKPCCLT